MRDIDLLKAYIICEKEGKNLRLTLKNGRIIEGMPDCYDPGYPEDNFDENCLLLGPDGKDVYFVGNVAQIISKSIIAKLEIVDRNW